MTKEDINNGDTKTIAKVQSDFLSAGNVRITTSTANYHMRVVCCIAIYQYTHESNMIVGSLASRLVAVACGHCAVMSFTAVALPQD